MPVRVGLIASLPEELRPTKRRLRLRVVPGHPEIARGTYQELAVTARLAGVGALAAARTARAVADEGCDLLISLGFAGGLDERLPAGVARSVAEVRGAGGQRLLPARSSSLPSAVLVTVAEAATTASEKAQLRAGSGADLVDMETWAVANVATELGLPWLGLRAVSDAAGDTLPDLVRRNVCPELGRVRTGRIVLGAMVAPWAWPGLIGLGIRSTRAGQALADAVVHTLEELR